MDKDYYKILGVNESDTAENIKLAYRKLARNWHPDVAGNSADVLSKFKEINEAYEILSDKLKKEEYDKARKFYKYAKYGAEYTSAKENKTTTNSGTKDSYTSNPYFKNFSFNWDDLFCGKQKNQENQKNEIPKPQRGHDISTDIEITIFEAMNGCEKVINMLQTTPCPKCGGRKFVNGNLCPYCNGKGEHTEHKKFTVKIPAGIKNNSKIRLSKEGERGQDGGANGDLYITIHVKEICDYETDGLNILKTAYITPQEAVLGTTLEIKTISGNYSVKIAPNTQNGRKIRLSGCGIVQNDKVGDMIIVLEIRIPQNLSKEEIELYKKLSEISSHNVRDSIYD